VSDQTQIEVLVGRAHVRHLKGLGDYRVSLKTDFQGAAVEGQLHRWGGGCFPCARSHLPNAGLLRLGQGVQRLECGFV
jgi:hypothetical protein